MKFLLLPSLLALASASIFSSSTPAPELEAKASFGPNNPLNNVYNGQQNQVLISLLNPSSSELTVTFIGGSFSKASDAKHLRNTTSLKYNLLIPPSGSSTSHPVEGEDGKPAAFQVPYQFWSEFPTGDIGLTLWVEYQDADKNTYRTLAFDDVITVVEPPSSFLDPALIFLYLILSTIFLGGGYLAYTNFVASGGKKKRSKRPVVAKSPVPVIDEVTGVEKKYEDSWIPEHHLKSRAKKSGAGGASGTSASEGEGASSGGEGRGRKKGRK
ncbi:hypothetical protein BT69DRAFT_1289877 [Atractiella rhizophila]|nr:hypothetical protein BT69DRAFT_1289877 [Atractiella rhizophila]